MSTINLAPTADIAQTGGWASTPNANRWQNVAESVADDDGSYNQAGGDGSFTVTHAPMPTAVSIQSLALYIRYKFLGSYTDQRIRVGLVIGGGTYWGSDILAVAGAYTTVPVGPWLVNPATGKVWTKGAIDATYWIVEYFNSLFESIRFTWLSGVPTFIPAPKQMEASRLVASQQLRLRRSRISLASIDLPLLRADAEILTDVAISHRDLPWASAGKRGVNPWERVLLRVLRQAPDYLAARTTLTGLDVRRYLTTLWDTLRSDEDPSTQYQGVARLNAGGGRTFVRDSPAWIPSPVAQARGLVRVIRIEADTEKTLYDGTLIEAAATNVLLRSSAVSGATGYTDSGASGSWSTAPSTDPLFDPSVTSNVIVGTAGSPHTADLVRQFPDTASLAANGSVAVQVDHKDDVGAALGWRLQRLVDNRYWNATAKTWDVGVVTNLMTVRTSWTPDPDRLGVVGYGASNTVLRFSIVIPSGGTAGRQNRIAHVQLGNETWYSSRIVTDDAAVTTAEDIVTYENNSGKRSQAAAQGSMRVTFIPSFNSSELAPGTYIFWNDYHDANNFEYLAYLLPSAAWWYVRSRAGVTTQATFAGAALQGVPVKLGTRWTGVAGEWGLAPYTQSIFVNGVKGVDAVAAGPINETATASLTIGGSPGGNRALGRLAEIDFSPFVLSDDEFVDA